MLRKGEALMEKWCIFITTHKHIFPRMYTSDPGFSLNHFKFVNISDVHLHKAYETRYNVLNIKDYHGFIPLGAHYVESETIYNLYRNPDLIGDISYIGFLHYDKELKPFNKTSFTQQINAYIKKRKKAHISFSTYKMPIIYNQRILADHSKPEVLIGTGRNCIDYILDDYNLFFNTRYSLKDLMHKEYINLESCFFIDIKTFEKMMSFCSWIIKEQKIDELDPKRLNRLQGGLLERYYGVFLALEYREFLDLTLPHHPEYKYFFLRAPLYSDPSFRDFQA
jgi:hypothetical protein